MVVVLIKYIIFTLSQCSFYGLLNIIMPKNKASGVKNFSELIVLKNNKAHAALVLLK